MGDSRSSAPLFSRRRIGLCGESGGLEPRAARFCEAVGAALIDIPNIVLVTAGAVAGRHRPHPHGGTQSADQHYVEGAQRRLRELRQPAEEGRVETILPSGAGRSDGYFEAGKVERVRGRTREARRFAFVRHVHALLAVSGGDGTRQSLTLAAALELPTLPVPSFGGAAKKHWEAHRDEIPGRLRFRPEEASALERWDGASELQHHAVSLVRRLAAVLGRTCFVITPFEDEFLPLYDSVIAPTVEQVGDRPVRLDVLAVPGDACRQVQEGIAAADYVIAVLDELRPNVLYELGLAHGHGKPTILVGRNGADGVIDLPFDLSTQQCATYDAPDASACARLAAAIQGLAHRLGR